MLLTQAGPGLNTILHSPSGIRLSQGTSVWHNHFATIGLVGVNEAGVNLPGCDIGSIEGKKFAEKLLDYMHDRLVRLWSPCCQRVI